MFIAMNRFQIAIGHEDDFETLWRNRETYLASVPGFLQFHLLKGPVADTHILYASYSAWEKRQSFDDWLESEAFKKAHVQARLPKETYLGPPVFEGFDVILSEPSAG